MEEIGRGTMGVRTVHSRTCRRRPNRVPLEEGEAFVVGAVGSAAPWFLTGGRKIWKSSL